MTEETLYIIYLEFAEFFIVTSVYYLCHFWRGTVFTAVRSFVYLFVCLHANWITPKNSWILHKIL